MALHRSLDPLQIIATLLRDVSKTHGVVFNQRSCERTISKVRKRFLTEGVGFLTKTLPRLGKALDRALTGETRMTVQGLRHNALPKTDLPRFLGEFFIRVFKPDGSLLPDPCVTSVRVLRQVLFLFYKYELPYTAAQEQQVVAKFEETERQLTNVQERLGEIRADLERIFTPTTRRGHRTTPSGVVREARILLSRLFKHFDPKDILPRHGPGAVATRQRLWAKYSWTNVSAKITALYPFDEYFCSSMGHVCDRFRTFSKVTERSLPARVCLVPKDSRGPRLISCEPVDHQWIQQGLGGAIVELVEHNELTKFNVFFTDQGPNRRGALLGSSTGRYATLDLNEASDRVSLELVRLLFPGHICEYLEACRSESTMLPSGEVLPLKKFAPMGSCLCFPILALTVWALLTAAAPDQDTQESILVYGDDVIVPTAFAGDAIIQLETFGLKVNREKSCLAGLFRESCGMDAFQGSDVTPLRLRTVWASSRSPELFTSWVAYANSFYERGYTATYDLIVGVLHDIYGEIPTIDMGLPCPSLAQVSEGTRPIRSRWNRCLQMRQWHVWDVKAKVEKHVSDGWEMLLRYFAEVANRRNRLSTRATCPNWWESWLYNQEDPFSVSVYTRRAATMLVKRWRGKTEISPDEKRWARLRRTR